MATAYRITRALTKEECPWLDEPIKEGALVFRYDGCTYGCVSGSGIAVTERPDKTPFFEVPQDAVELAGY